MEYRWDSELKRHPIHYSDVIVGMIASEITSLTVLYSTVHSGTDQRKHQSSASLAFVRGIHWWPVNSPHKWPVTLKMFSFDDVIMVYTRLWPKKDTIPGPQGRTLECLLCEFGRKWLFLWYYDVRTGKRMMTSSNGNIFRGTGHLCEEFIGLRWIPPQRPVTRSFDVFFDLGLNKRLSKP